jgi:hypothetical protein
MAHVCSVSKITLPENRENKRHKTYYYLRPIKDINRKTAFSPGSGGPLVPVVPQPKTKGSSCGRPERCGLEDPLFPIRSTIFYFSKKFQIFLLISQFLIFNCLIG